MRTIEELLELLQEQPTGPVRSDILTEIIAQNCFEQTKLMQLMYEDCVTAIEDIKSRLSAIEELLSESQ